MGELILQIHIDLSSSNIVSPKLDCNLAVLPCRCLM